MLAPTLPAPLDDTRHAAGRSAGSGPRQTAEEKPPRPTSAVSVHQGLRRPHVAWILFIGAQIALGLAAYAYVRSQTPVHEPRSRQAAGHLWCDGQAQCDPGAACDKDRTAPPPCIDHPPIGR